MFVFSNLFSTIGSILNMLLTIYFWIIFARAVLSWVRPDPYNPIVQFIYKTTEPFLIPFQKIVPAYRIGVDLSPLFALAVLWILRVVVVNSLIDLAGLIK